MRVYSDIKKFDLWVMLEFCAFFELSKSNLSLHSFLPNKVVKIAIILTPLFLIGSNKDNSLSDGL